MMITVAKSKRVAHTVHPFIQQQQSESQADEKAQLKVIAQSLREAAKKGTEALAAYWNTVAANYRNPDMVAFYNAELAKAQEVDRQKDEQRHISAGVVPVEQSAPRQQQETHPQYEDTRDDSGIEDF